MGTTIKITANKDHSTIEKDWQDFKMAFLSIYDDVEDEEDGYLNAPCVHLPYSCAYISKIVENVEEHAQRSFKGTGISLELYYLEREPDDEIIL